VAGTIAESQVDEAAGGGTRHLRRGNTPGKIVSQSKIAEWRGLDRIGVVVHGMKCIWREQEKDDIGIDGEIELCRSRDDGDGLVGTGKIVKVQSKSGSSYVIKDEDASFSSPVKEKDLIYWNDLNVPIIYVVYHPDDDALYWKDVKAYLRDHPDALQPPHRIDFDKARDRFDQNAYDALFVLCEQAPDRIATDVGETLYSNLLPVLSLPERIWVAPVLPEKQPQFHRRLRGAGAIPPYSYKSGMVATLTHPCSEGSALAQAVDEGAAEDFGLDDWLSQNADNENDLRALLNGLLHRQLRRIGCDYQKDPRRYFFNKGLAEDAPIRRSWTTRTGRTHSRLVSKYYSYGRVSFYRHQAVDARFERFGSRWAIGIYPQLHFTTDGTTQWKGKIAKSYLIRARAEEYNNVYLNNVLFWAHQLSAGEREFDLRVDDQPVVTVSGAPLLTETTFSIRTIGPTEKKRG
jgi:hypothetical protein